MSSLPWKTFRRSFTTNAKAAHTSSMDLIMMARKYPLIIVFTPHIRCSIDTYNARIFKSKNQASRTSSSISCCCSTSSFNVQHYNAQTMYEIGQTSREILTVTSFWKIRRIQRMSNKKVQRMRARKATTTDNNNKLQVIVLRCFMFCLLVVCFVLDVGSVLFPSHLSVSREKYIIISYLKSYLKGEAYNLNKNWFIQGGFCVLEFDFESGGTMHTHNYGFCAFQHTLLSAIEMPCSFPKSVCSM